MKKTTLILAAALLCVCLLTGCGYSLEGGQPDGEVVSNDGIALRQGDYIYYINGSMPTLLSDALSGSDQAAVFRMKADGTQKQRLSTKKTYAIYVHGEYLYLLSPVSADRLAIYEISINGGMEREIIKFENTGYYAFSDYGVAAEMKNSVLVYSFASRKSRRINDVEDVAQLYGADRLYYYSSRKAGIMAVDWNGGEPEQITSRNGRIKGVKGSNLYYIKDDEKLTCHDMSTGEESFLTASKYKTMLFSAQNNASAAYSKEKTAFYIMHLDGSNRIQIDSGEAITAYAMGSDRVYYCKNSEGAIYEVDYDGNNKKKIADVSALNGPGTTDPDYYMDIVDKKLFLFDRSDATVYTVDTESGEVKNLAKD